MKKIESADTFGNDISLNQLSKLSEKENIPGDMEACIQNILYGKEFITREEALEQINHLSGVLSFDYKYRRHQAERKKYLRT